LIATDKIAKAVVANNRARQACPPAWRAPLSLRTPTLTRMLTLVSPVVCADAVLGAFNEMTIGSQSFFRVFGWGELNLDNYSQIFSKIG
jgi:hypothetical protein